MSSIPFGTKLARDDVVGRTLVEIYSRHRFDVDGLDWCDAFFELDSGATFALPFEDAGGFVVEPPLAECQRTQDPILRAILGEKISAVVRTVEGTEESPYLLLASGNAIMHVMGAPHGVNYAGLYISAPGELDVSCMVDFFEA